MLTQGEVSCNTVAGAGALQLLRSRGHPALLFTTSLGVGAGAPVPYRVLLLKTSSDAQNQMEQECKEAVMEELQRVPKTLL